MGGSYDLHNIVRNLRSHKSTDRKRAFTLLRNALKDQSTLTSLDKNTLDKVSLTWDLVATSIAKIIEQELDKSAGNGKVGPDVPAAVDLLRKVVQLANRRKSLLNPRKILEHVQWFLDKGACEPLQTQYNSLLRLLLHSDWQATLPASLYRSLVKGVCKLLCSDKRDVVGLSNALHQLIISGFYQDDASLETVLATVSGSFGKIRETGTASQVVLQLSILVEVGRRLGGRRRRLLCDLGQPLMRTLLRLCTWNSLQIKMLALEFLALQLSLHRSDTDQGVWQCLLEDWHELLMQQLQERPVSVLNQQEDRIRGAQVWLAAEILHQLETWDTAVAALLATKLGCREVVPRLETVACYLWRYPESASHTCLQKLLGFLTQCYSSCKMLDVKRCVLLCYYGVAHAVRPGHRSWPMWNVVWEQTVKTVFLNQCVEEGHLVLQELLRKQLASCSDLASLFCPGRSLEPMALRSLCVVLHQATYLDVAAVLPDKHRWRLWLLECLLPATVQLGSATVLVGELLTALCLKRPATALSHWNAPQVWHDPYPWRAGLDADLERRITAVSRTDCVVTNAGSEYKTATVVETAWEATLDALVKQGLAFLDSTETLPACLCSGVTGAILLTRLWRMQVKQDLFESPLIEKLQSCLRDCTEKLLQPWEAMPAWLGLLETLLSYVEGGPSPASEWVLGALPQELDACLLSTLPLDGIDDIGASRLLGTTKGNHVDLDSEDQWACENLSSPSLASSQSSSSGDEFAEPVFSDMAATVLSPERLTLEETQQLMVLRTALSYFCLSRHVAGRGAFDQLLHVLQKAARWLSAWNIQAALLVLRVLLERAKLLTEAELFLLVDALRELMKVHCRQLDVSTALLEVARLCVPALSSCTHAELRQCFLVVLEAYAALLSQGILNEAASSAFLRLLLDCLQEPARSQVRLTVEGQLVSVLEYTLRFLGSNHDSVRTLAAEKVALFLSGQQPVSLQSMLPLLSKHLEADVSKEDEHYSGCLVYATALANAAIALGPHRGGKAVAVLLRAVQDRGLPSVLAAKVLGFADSKQEPWAMVHLPAVVYYWLKQGLPLDLLPITALGCSSATQFWKCHWVHVLPAVVDCCDTGAVELVSDCVGRPAKELLLKVAPSVLSRGLPRSEPLRFLEEQLSPEVVEQVLVDRLPEVLVCVLQLACDIPGHAVLSHDELYPPCLAEGQVHGYLRLLEGKCGADLLAVLLRKRDGVQLVLEGLQQPAGLSLAALHHLVAMLSPARPNGLGGSECFVLRTLTRQLLRKLPDQGSAGDTEKLVAFLLRQLYATTPLYKETARSLPVIINALAPFVGNESIDVEVHRLVEILLSDERLEAAVLRLSPLPPGQVSLSAVHSRLKKRPLTQVLAMFAESLKQGLLSGHEDIGTLVALSSLLKQRHAELLQDIQGKLFFSEMAVSSPLHQLLVVLFEQARSSHKQVREASLHCLGILGPMEWHLPCLSTAHWNPISGMVDEADKGCQHITYAFIFRRMERYLSHPDTKLSHAACQALRSALATPTGFAFASQHRHDDDMVDIFSLLHPFVPSHYDVHPQDRPPGGTDHSQLWAPEDACNHAAWITNLVCTLVRCCNDPVLWALLPLCTMAVDLCELLLPLVVETLADDGTHWNAVVAGMATFLQCHAQLKDDAPQKSQSTGVSEPMSTEVTRDQVYCSQASVAVLMSAVERMLVRRDAKALTLWKGLRLGHFNFLQAAQAAEFCGHHVVAVQCVELWCDTQARTSEDGGLLYWSAAEAAPVQSVLVSSLSGLGDLDALTGCRCLALGVHFSLWRHWAEQQGAQWPTLLAQADLEATGRNVRLGHALKQCGLYNTLTAYLEPGTPDLAELQAECAWRLANWDCRLSKNDQGRRQGLHCGIFMALSSMTSQDADELCSGLKACRELLSSRFSSMAQLGSTQQLNQLLTKLQMCTVLEEGAALLHRMEDDLLARWEQRAAQPAVQFDIAEPVLWLQGVVLGQLKNPQAEAARTTILAQYAGQARINQRLALARVALRQLECCAPGEASRWLLEEARIQLAQGDCTQAQHTLWTLLRQLSQQHEVNNTDGVTRAYAEVLQLYGECLAGSRLESSDTIAKEYFDKAVHVLSGRAEEALWAAHLRLAQFADSQLQSIEQYLRSPEFIAKQELLQQSSHILESSGKRTSMEEAHAMRLLERQSNLDRGEEANLKAAQKRHLLQAIGNYLQCLRGGHDLRLFRLVSLWVTNAAVPEVNSLLKHGLSKLESHKFVPLFYQLAARMSQPDGSTFPQLLFQLIERVVRDHPYQTLPVVLALCNADKDSTATARQAKKAKTTEDRVEGARHLVSQLRKGNGLCSKILGPLERLMDAYINLAYLDPPNAPRGQIRLPRETPLLKLGTMDSIPVLTQNVEVDRSGSYRNLPGILRFSAHYRLCGGINKPKVITCVSQDGCEYKQLVKGRDDLRQDAVMQQAFGLVNCLLAQKGTAGRLAMRTYKVVPLSRRSGLVQWCEGTQPFSEFLLTPQTGAHQRYQPHDWTAATCRSAMQKVHKGSPAERLHVYQEICSHFRPVFRYFFFEQYPEPSRWFERRRAYIHSVATGSVVGYVLGLGDRHCANILVDKHSAELIHIDLGVAFEQGRVLNTPETVPFRLTRDVVDGMGICGVEGTFRRCCERTMEVMRASRELLVTVVEVLLHDPLSSWTLSPERAAALQAEGDAPTRRPSPDLPHNQGDNRLARRMLLRLEQKLQGLEEGAPLSVAGQVNLLIQQARDPHNLSRLFPGWQPYV